MTREIEVELCGRRLRALLVDRVYERRKNREKRGKQYTWVERYIVVYIPRRFEASSFILLPADEVLSEERLVVSEGGDEAGATGAATTADDGGSKTPLRPQTG